MQCVSYLKIVAWCKRKLLIEYIIMYILKFSFVLFLLGFM